MSHNPIENVSCEKMQNSSKTALIFGPNGQDGSYLAELLLKMKYTVVGVIRRSSSFNTGRIDHIRDKLTLEYGDVTDFGCTLELIQRYQPDEIYNLAAMSHVGISYKLQNYTVECDAVGTLNILQAIRLVSPKSKFYQASTSELFGNTLVSQKSQDSQSKLTLASRLDPVSPYAAAKLYAYQMVKIYREGYGLFCTQGILFNHESPRRGENFVTQKIAQWVKRIGTDKEYVLRLGNLDSKRDWGSAQDYVFGMWLILQYDKPRDWLLATGEQHSVREFVEIALGVKNHTIEWKGSGVDEKGYVNGKLMLEVDPVYFRPIDVVDLLGDPSEAENLLGWKREYSFKDLVKDMVLN
jgi:GDPmannose 4,6-dehydratase